MDELSELGEQPTLMAGLPTPDVHPSSDHQHRRELAEFRLTLQQMGLDWGEQFEMLSGEMGVTNWRKAAFIAWLMVPEEMRVPRYQQDLAPLLGLSTQTRRFAEWKRQASTQALIMRFSGMSILVEHLPAVDRHLLEQAFEPGMTGYYNKKLLYERLGVMEREGQINVNVNQPDQLRKMSTAELRTLLDDGAIEGALADDGD